ncbi:hypothetical protein EAF00_005667 [Botryotinia globosa]|nr:hypothetical protein EAF00_005667 [Botryotinia globosa]
MGELDELVTTLLGTFTSGIRLLRARRKRQKISSGKIDHDNCEETLLIRSFKQSRSDIREAYTRESIKSGPKFSEGDAKARSSISTILSRLNTAFTSAVVLFSRGKVKPADQELFIKLSNKSRAETINALDNLSKRISKSSSSSLVSRDTATRTHKKKPASSQSITRQEDQETSALPKPAAENRKSGFSFASDSTKLGEIPPSRIARLLPDADTSSHDHDPRYYPIAIAFPLAPYQPAPRKRRFGVRRLWKRRLGGEGGGGGDGSGGRSWSRGEGEW